MPQSTEDLKTKPAIPKSVASRSADAPAAKPVGESSTTSAAEALPESKPPTKPTEKADAEAKIATLTKEYDGLLAQTREAKGDVVKTAPLLRRKGEVTREIDALKRGHDIA